MTTSSLCGGWLTLLSLRETFKTLDIARKGAAWAGEKADRRSYAAAVSGWRRSSMTYLQRAAMRVLRAFI
jgi:hypothetical protein